MKDCFIWLLEGDVSIFNTVIGAIQDLKDIAGRVGPDQEKCLRVPLVLFDAAVIEQEVI